MFVQQMENMQIEAIFFMLHAIKLIKVLQNILTEIKVHFLLADTSTYVSCLRY